MAAATQTRMWVRRPAGRFRHSRSKPIAAPSRAAMATHQDKLLEVSGQFARIFSSNFDPKEPYGLPAQNRRYIEIGYEIGRSGAFGPPASLNGKR